MANFEALGFQSDEQPTQTPPGKFEGMGFVPHGTQPAQKAAAPSAAPMASNGSPESAPVDNTPGAAQSGLEFFGQGLTARYLPHFQAAVSKAIDSAGLMKDVVADKVGMDDLASVDYHLRKQGFKIPDDTYLQIRDANINRMLEEEKAHPELTSKAEVAGNVVGASMLGAGAPIKGATLAARLGQAALAGARGGAIYGAIQNPGDIEGKISPLQLKERVENAGEGMAGGAAVGPVFHGAIEGLQTIPGAAKATAKKVANIVSSIPEETTARYFENPKVINESIPRPELGDKIAEMRDLAKDNLTEAQQKMISAQADYADQKEGAKERFERAQETLREKLKEHSLTDVAGDVLEAGQNLRKQVDSGSKESLKILENHGGQFSVQPIIDDLDKSIERLQIRGVARSPEANAAIDYLVDEQNRLREITKDSGGMISGPEAKLKLQDYGKSGGYGKQSVNARPDQAEAAMQSARETLDGMVKDAVPEYKAKMADVSRQTKLLNQVDEIYGTPKKAIENLNNIDSEVGQELHFPIIKDLEKETGKTISPSVDDYINTQKILKTKSVFRKLMENTPEGRDLALAQAKRMDVDVAKEGVESATQKSGVFKGVSPTVTNQLKKVGTPDGRVIETALRNIDKEHGTNFLEQVQAANDLAQFSKTDTNGSRKTLWGTVTGAAIGGIAHALQLIGGEGILGMAAVGSNVGASSDKYSGAAAKYGINKARNISEAAQKISNLLSRDIGVEGAGAVTAAVSPKINSEKLKGQEKWARDGFQNLMQESGAKEAFEGMEITPKIKKLLIQASYLTPGSRAMKNVMNQIKAQRSGETK